MAGGRNRGSAIQNSDDARRPFFTPKALAAYLSVSGRTVRQMIAERRIDSVLVGGSRRIPAESVDAYVARNLEKAR